MSKPEADTTKQFAIAPLPPPGRATPGRWSRHVAAAAMLAALAACGGGSDSKVSASPPPPDPVVPDPVPDPTPTAAAECLNPALYATAGTVIQSRYDLRLSGTTSTATQTQTVEGPATLNGQAATRVQVRETTQTSGRPDETFEGAYYLALVDQSVNVVGTTANFESGGQQIVQTIVMDPPQPDLDFSLAAGASKTVVSTSTVSFEPAFAPTGSANATVKITFAGFESVTVPAGTFPNACKFTLDLTTSFTRSSTRWVARGTGIVLRTDSGEDSQQLVSATIDGVAVAP